MSIEQLTEGQTFETTILTNQEEVSMHCKIGRDTNRLHYDPAYAKTKGLKGCLVPGSLFVSWFSGLIVSVIGDGTVGSSELSKFRGFVIIGETITLQIKVKKIRTGTGLLPLSCLVILDGKNVPVAHGEATVTILPDIVVES
ncbi:MAG TPA: MaoC/PaaZ C-terminal domain-containing protein [Candidatus Paceibacterota bacterium]|nr:MaoC/PaaZ C-terminal domain-containing protein [Candidatus Paceibacterota bacterium]